MPRKGHIAKRTVEADPVYGSDLVTKFINSMMWQGKKSTAEGIFYEALTRLQQKAAEKALNLLKKPVRNANPWPKARLAVEGAPTYKVRGEVTATRGTHLGTGGLTI